MFNVGPGELIVVLLLALIIFGPGKLPDVGRALGRTINEFKRATRQVQEDLTSEAPPRPAQPPAQDAASSGAPRAAGAGPGSGGEGSRLG